MEKITFNNVPTWALYALEYGTNEAGDLSDEDIQEINNFVNEHFPHGYIMDVNWESEGFSCYPLFGLACDVVTVDFYADK